ncbi:uncharacterized protein LOC128734450 [Sabethes cyaneus]|uniref:uncharacterized protein LOC128734450 n=1 Tax=Sabethes cyaneus TaxID=53552 RepID=UPI00237D513B|nr:uncharacterized protein LOC128734450 [Sabethes cyaneus]
MSRTNVSCVKWVDFGDHMISTFLEVYLNSAYTDVTLVLADGGQLVASRMVLSMASKFFADIFQTAFNSAGFYSRDAQESKIMIPDVKFGVMKNVLNFIYTGEVNMNARDMSDFFEVCKLLQLKGLDYQNGNISGVKISGSNIITPVQFDYEEVQEVYVEESTNSVVEVSEVNIAEAGNNDSVENNRQTSEETGIPAITEEMAEYYEVDVDIGVLDTNTDSEDSKPNYQQTVVVHNENINDITVHTSDEEHCKFTVEEIGESSCQLKKRTKTTEYGTRLNEAINTIINDGASFRTASIQFGIPKTVLWRKAIKAPNYKAERSELPSPRKEAIEALKSGEKLLNISKRLDIPLSTLHRDKLKLYSEGILPDNVSLKQRDKGLDFKDRVLEAAQQCVAGYMSQSEASKLYKLPKTTIWRKIKALKGESNKSKHEESPVHTDSVGEGLKSEMIEILAENESDSVGIEEHLEPEFVVGLL